MKRILVRLQLTLAIVAVLLAPSWAPTPTPVVAAKVTKTVIMKTATGAAQQVSTTHVYTHKITFQSKVGNAATVYVGPATLTSSNFAASLAAGQGYTASVSYFYDDNAEEFDLSDWYVLGTASDMISISYEVVSAP